MALIAYVDESETENPVADCEAFRNDWQMKTKRGMNVHVENTGILRDY